MTFQSCHHGFDPMFCVPCRREHHAADRLRVKEGKAAYFVFLWKQEGKYHARDAASKPYKSEAAANRAAEKLNEKSEPPGYVVRLASTATELPPGEERRLRGIVKWWNDSKGYGFLSVAGHLDVFAHYTALYMEGFKTLKEGQEVEFTLIQGPKGPQASEIHPMKGNP